MISAISSAQPAIAKAQSQTTNNSKAQQPSFKNLPQLQTKWNPGPLSWLGLGTRIGIVLFTIGGLGLGCNYKSLESGHFDFTHSPSAWAGGIGTAFIVISMAASNGIKFFQAKILGRRSEEAVRRVSERYHF